MKLSLNFLHTLLSFTRSDGVDLTDEELIRKAQNENISAFDTLVKRYQHKLFPYAVTITRGNHDLASDILQESLLKAYLNIRTLDPSTSFLKWMWKIMKNQFIDFLRSPRGKKEISMDLVSESAMSTASKDEREVIEEERKKHLLDFIARLPENYREILILIDLEGLTYEEASEITNIPQNTVKSRLFRAREKLAEILHKNRELFT